jgi:hypothetical protein
VRFVLPDAYATMLAPKRSAAKLEMLTTLAASPFSSRCGPKT